jgi:hypothetical protein
MKDSSFRGFKNIISNWALGGGRDWGVGGITRREGDRPNLDSIFLKEITKEHGPEL